jgi:hypothetical protein
MMLDPRRQVVDLKALNPRTTLDAKRAAALVDKLRQTKAISHEEWRAACILRDLHHAVHDRPSEGVGNYDLYHRDGDGAAAANHRADRIIRRVERSRGELLERYNNAVFAMVGVIDERGERMIDSGHLRQMTRAILDTEASIRQDEVGQAVSSYKPGKGNKQIGAAGAMFVKHCLSRLVLHFGLVNGEALPQSPPRR